MIITIMITTVIIAITTIMGTTVIIVVMTVTMMINQVMIEGRHKVR
jgi:hypothetical protein